MNQFEGIFEMFDVIVRRLANGNKIRIVLECNESVEIESQLIMFRGDNVKVSLTQEQAPEKKKDQVFIEDIYEVFDIKCRRLRNGDKLSLILEQLYEKEKEAQLVKLRYDNIKIFMEKIQEELFDEPNEDIEDPDITDPEE